MHRPTGDLYEILGLSGPVNPTVAKSLGYKLAEQGELTPDQQYAWKALSDPHYSSLYDDTRSTEALYKAGFFNDGLAKIDHDHLTFDSNFATTPTYKFLTNYRNKGRGVPAVMVTTGGMAPIHNGHMAMMEEAKRIAKFEGFDVLAGYFAPGHDSYVGQKYNGTAAIPAADRCAMVELACQDSDWLDCDPWAARYMPGEVNFPTVCDRLREMIRFQTGISVAVIYVHGSDNGGFSAGYNGHTIEVERTAISSKLAREGQHDHLDPRVRDYLLSWQHPDTGTLPYLIRNEENMAIGRFGLIAPLEELEKRRIALQSTIRLGISHVFKSLGHANKIHLLPVSDQTIEAKKVIGDRKTISLDPFFPGDYHLDSTRYFKISEAQFKPLYRSNRLGNGPMEEQAQQIEAGQYVLVEDDTVTGGTIMSAKAVLPSSVEITDQVILSDFAEYAGTSYYDVVDLRDFIVGSTCGGLSVVTGSGRHARAPYALPYVSLRARAKIPAAAEMEISRIVWQANMRFYKDLNIRVRDCDPGTIALAQEIGMDTLTNMETFCKWHMDRFLEVVIG